MTKHQISGALNTIKANETKAFTAGPIIESNTADVQLRGTRSGGFDRVQQELAAAVGSLAAFVKTNADGHSGQVIDYQADDPKTPKAPAADVAWHKAKGTKAGSMVRSWRRNNASDPLASTNFVEYTGVGCTAAWHLGDARTKRTGEVETFVAMWVRDEDLPELNFDGRTVIMEDGSELVMPRLAYFHFLRDGVNMNELEDLINDVRKIGASVKEYRKLEEEAEFANPEDSDDEY